VIIISERKTKTIETIWAIVCRDANGVEGIVRRDTPYGTQPLTTDDPKLISAMISLAKENGFKRAELRIAQFNRAPLE
jgi:hypothetical protein